ncbi:hypothetical protein [Mycobacterium sp.]|uniref:hypothetical protein n=1 Tax=Mycobacterium sp. TaxID=1785 RepID=UPI00260E661E|nr:hypothetical protein [Mycobacterium sp.]
MNPQAGLADLVMEVRHERITASGQLVPAVEPGQAMLTILRNRRGPRCAFSVGFFAHLARYFDVDS